MIDVQQVSKRYGPFTAVDNVSFRVESGEILGFLGPNGAGKTTTMRIITGYMPATEGKVSVAGYDVFEQPIEAKRRIGYLPETPPLYPDMTVREYLLFVARIKGVRKDIPGRVAEVSATLDQVAADGLDYDRLALLTLSTVDGLVGDVIQDVVTLPAEKSARLQGDKGFVEWRVNHQSGKDAVLSGAGGKAFAAGTDIAQFRDFRTPDDGVAYETKLDEALAAKQANEKRVILFNLSGHGLMDMASYDAYLSGHLND